jgi:hypothetical protein
MLKSERRLWIREFSDLKPFEDIPASFYLFNFQTFVIGKTARGFTISSSLSGRACPGLKLFR